VSEIPEARQTHTPETARKITISGENANRALVYLVFSLTWEGTWVSHERYGASRTIPNGGEHWRGNSSRAQSGSLLNQVRIGRGISDDEPRDWTSSRRIGNANRRAGEPADISPRRLQVRGVVAAVSVECCS
jgi:hypothetical protein